MKHINKLGLPIVAFLVLVGVFSGYQMAHAAANLTISSSTPPKIISPNIVQVNLDATVDALSTVDFTKWHIDAVDGGGSSLTPISATIIYAGGPWTINLTFSGTPFSDSSKYYSAATGLYVDAGGVTDVGGDTNVVIPHSASIAIVDGQKPTLVSGKITGPHEITLVYSEPVTSTLTDYISENISGSPSDTTAISGSGTNTIKLTFPSPTAITSATGSITIRSTVKDISPAQNTFTTVTGQVLSDGQAPTLTSITVSDAQSSNGRIDRAVLVFSEAILDSSIHNDNTFLGTSGSTWGTFTTGTANDNTTTFNRTIDDAMVDTTANPIVSDFVYHSNDITDLAGNILYTSNPGKIETEDAVEIDGANPIITDTTPANSTQVNQGSSSTYTFSEAVADGTITFSRTGGSLDGVTHNYNFVNGGQRSSGSHSIPFSTLEGVFGSLVDGAIYSISYYAIDATENQTTVTNTLVTYSIIFPSTPTATPTADIYTSTQSVALSSEGSTSIMYSTDGSDPSVEDCSIGPYYTDAISVTSSITIKAVGCDDAGNKSPLGTFVYTINLPQRSGGGHPPFYVPVVPAIIKETLNIIPVISLGVPIEKNINNDGECPASLIITDNMQKNDRNGRYSKNNNGIIKQVALLQTHINRILASAYDKAAGPIDGIYGKLTKQGVERLQEALNSTHQSDKLLKIDGIVGILTKEAINNSCGN